MNRWLPASLLYLVILLVIIAPDWLLAEPNEAPPDPNPSAYLDDPNAAFATTEPNDPNPAAAEIETELEKWVQKLKNAGATIPVLLFLSVIGVGMILERFFTLRRRKFAPTRIIRRVHSLWQADRLNEIEHLCAKRKDTYSTVIHFIVTHLDNSVADISTTAGDIAARDLKRHLIRAYPLAIIATVAPLLGLLGTVSGMVGAFDTVAMMGELGDAGALGGDISKALVSTLVGLVVAIPSLFAYHYFKSRTQFFGVILEEEITTLITDRLMKKEAGNAN